jgi:dipeptidyl aminopeptidase/acylaminoacyl peptidase
MLDLESLLRVPQVDAENSFDLAPDGEKLAFAWNRSGQWEIYQKHLADGGEIELLTHGPGGKFSPRYSPEGKKLAYVVDLDGSEAFDIWLMDLENQRAENLTPDTPFAFQPNLSWSPDGTQIACICDRKGAFCTYLLDLETRQLRLVLDTPNPDWDLSISPDGTWLAVEAEGQAQDYQVHLISTPGGQALRLEMDGKPLNARQVCWSPDSQHLALVSDLDGFANIAMYHLQGGKLTWLTSGEGDKSMPAWSADGRQLAYLHSQGPENWIVVLMLESGQAVRYQVGPGVHARPTFAPDGDQLVVAFESPSHPTDLWLLSLSDGACSQLTQSLPEEFNKSLFSMPVHLEYESLDGVRVPALLYSPAPSQTLPPAVLLVHGGPNWLFQYNWYPLIQHMLSRGWLVLAPNYRGSTGYGREWQLASRFDLGGVDAADVMAGAAFLQKAGLADPNRIVVTGRSHGGYLTMVCLTQAPEIWAGGSAVVPFLNWFTGHANSREDLQHWDLENMGDPVTNAELWRSRSPYFYLDRISAPVQLICGANDPRCPASESIEARERLLAMGKAVDFHLYPDEGHAFLKMDNLINAELQRVDFLARRLEARQ